MSRSESARRRGSPHSLGLLEALRHVLAIRADLIAESGELAETLAHGGQVRVEQLDKARKHFGIGVMATVEGFELLHLGERETEHLELLDELEPADIVVGVDALPAIEPLHRFEEAALLVVTNGPLGQSDLRGQLPDPICASRGRRRRHRRQFTSTGDWRERSLQESPLRRRAAISSSAFRSAAAP